MPAEPRTAAACVIVRGDTQPEVLLAKRSSALRFMAGHHVFPGGRVHETENTERVTHATDPAHARAILAAVREVFEETGLLCVRGSLPPREVTRDARRRVIQDELKFPDF